MLSFFSQARTHAHKQIYCHKILAEFPPDISIAFIYTASDKTIIIIAIKNESVVAMWQTK